MARHARITDINGIYHIVIKQSDSKPLFPNDTYKDALLEKITESKIKYQFIVYAYCLMDTHAHFIIDSNGEKISDIMKNINLRYAKHYNKNKKTNGPLLKERFFSELITSDEYLLKASLYIHANPKDTIRFSAQPQAYKYSSMRFYLGEKDELEIIDTSFILSILSKKIYYAIESYAQLFEYTLEQNAKHFKELDLSIKIKLKNKEFKIDINNIEFEVTRNTLKRDFETEQIIKFIEEETGILRSSFLSKNTHGVKLPKALFALLSGIYTRKSTYEIAFLLGGMSIEQVSMLCNDAIQLVLHNPDSKNMIQKFYKENK